ncbi:hypothetical protein HYFRA_00005402 [Hymenoscyphus fraxineus]|uniref:Major facilitator superfamily (MFS) profile domain-containing protein n=1 Tax=Hymenoscyphus fraxineus TaxID=746836 RepID=A0A9N9PWC9_9HELO|nr:hypothetical protein HYFRA_00005402 [Hymenoscyphus fraxineus]
MEKKPQMNHAELDAATAKKLGLTNAEDQELQIALSQYVPGSDAEKKLVRKIDMRLMPCLWIMYVLNYVDRTNIGNARIAGMADDLNLDDQKYAWVLSIFFFGYLLCEVPSNMILSRSRPSLFLPAIVSADFLTITPFRTISELGYIRPVSKMLVWGALSASMAASHSYAALLAFRFFLGCIESGFFPGVLYLLSCWYKPAEIGKRFAIFYSAAVLSGAFGGLLAGGITGGMHNAHGIDGWRWLFIIEGVATVGVAIIAPFILLDFPASSKALTLEERQLATVRILSVGIESGASGPRLTHWQALKAAMCDIRTYLFMLLFVFDVGAGTISYFIPTLTVAMGYSTTTAQYMTIPVYIVATVVLNIVAYSADRCNERRYHISAALALGFVCSIVCVAVPNLTVRYVMLCFVAAGIWTALPLILAWVSSTINLPAEKRAICLAIINAVGNLSSVYGSRIWPNHTAPRYTIGWAVTAAFLGAGMILALLIPVLIKVIPNKLTKAERELEERREITRQQALEEVV